MAQTRPPKAQARAPRTVSSASEWVLISTKAKASFTSGANPGCQNERVSAETGMRAKPEMAQMRPGITIMMQAHEPNTAGLLSNRAFLGAVRRPKSTAATTAAHIVPINSRAGECTVPKQPTAMGGRRANSHPRMRLPFVASEPTIGRGEPFGKPCYSKK